MNAIALSLNPSISFNEPFLIKGLFWKGRGKGGVLKKRMKTNRGRGGVKPLSVLTLWKKIASFFKQQIEFLLISCLIVAKSLLKRCRHFFKHFFIYEHVKIFIVVIVDISVQKALPSFMLSLQNNNSYLFFHSPIFHSKIYKHFVCKLNRDEQGKSETKIRSFE